MRRAICLSLVVLASLPALAAAGGFCQPSLTLLNHTLSGQVVDYTCNHGADRRIFSPALGCPRDLYVYLPPGFDPHLRYPLMIYLHGYGQDETGFLEQVVAPLDWAITCGRLPPMIVVAPDGTLHGSYHGRETGSFFINSRAGNFQDWIVDDVWDFVLSHYPIRPEPEAHILAGVSMGGLGAYNIALKRPDRFRLVIGILPVLNLRWVDCCGNYFGNFHPDCWGWRTNADDPNEVVGRFLHGLIKVRLGEAMYPVFGPGDEGVAKASEENPIELVERLCVKPGCLDMYVGYVGQDEFNLDAHAESFLYVVRSRGFKPFVYYDPTGHHSGPSAVRMLPSAVDWLNERLRCYGVQEPVPVGLP